MKFDAKKEIEKITEFIKNYFNDCHIDGVVMGISGGKDSTIASALFAKALGSENVIGVTIPCNSLKQDADDAKRVADHIGFKLYEFDLTDVFQTQFDAINKVFDIDPELTKEAAVNLKPRLRMSTLFYLAQAISLQSGKRYIVAGTGNKCEIFVGYFTKFGDGASDINILADLTVSEVVAIGDALGLPKDLVYKTPSDGLSGKSDEEKLGVTYNQIEKTINLEEINPQIVKMHNNIKHKLRPVVTYKKIDVTKEIEIIVNTLIKNNETIATMESCTAGLLATTITDVKDAGNVFKYGANTYSNEAKIKMGVAKETIDKYSVYSKEVAREMALKITELAASDYGVGITGEISREDGEVSEVFAAVYAQKEDKYYDIYLRLHEKIKNEGKEKVIAQVIRELGEITNENKEN